VASANGKNAQQLVRDTVDRMLADQAQFVDGVSRGIAQASNGEAVDHSEVHDRIDQLFRR
jgi:predicted transcriptional regulator